MKTLIITRYVKQMFAFAVSFITAKLRRVALGFVNVFKKKSSGASVCKTEKNFYIESIKGITVAVIILSAIGILLRTLQI